MLHRLYPAAEGKGEEMARRSTLPALLALIVTGALVSPAVAAPGDLTIASTTDEGVKGSDQSSNPSLSADGTRVAFISRATNLDPRHTEPGTSEVYVKDFTTGDLILASVTQSGTNPVGSQVGEPDLSGDGTTVAFACSGLIPDAAYCVKDLATGEVVDPTPGVADHLGDIGSDDPSLSADGSVVAFAHAVNMDGSACDSEHTLDIWVTRLSPTPSPPQRVTCSHVFFDSFDPKISADGTRVAFMTNEPFAPADTDACGPPELPPVCGYDIYVADLVTGELNLASATDDGTDANESSNWADISPDGTRVAFATWATNLDPADTDGREDYYVKDLVTGDVTWVSTDATHTMTGGANLHPSLSADGTKVAITSSRLLEVDNDFFGDIYIKDLVTGDLSLASTSDTGVKGCGISQEPSISHDGARVAFWGPAHYLEPGEDDNSIPDVFLKEVGGGAVFSCGATPGTADLSVTKSDSPDPVTVGNNLTYTITVSNSGPDDAPGVVLTDDLPGSVAFGSATPSQGSCSHSAGTVTCPLGTITPGAPATVAIVVTPNSPGTLTNSASVSSDVADSNPANNVDSEDTVVNPASTGTADLSVTKVDLRDPTHVGRRLSYRVTVKNLGPGTATSVTLTDQLPPGVDFVSATPKQGSCAQDTGVVTCDLGSVAKRAVVRVLIIVRPTTPDTLSNTVSVFANESDPNTTNNADTETTTVT